MTGLLFHFFESQLSATSGSSSCSACPLGLLYRLSLLPIVLFKISFAVCALRDVRRRSFAAQI